MSCFQTASDNPFLRRQIAVLVEIALEGRQAPTGVKRYLSHQHFIHVILFHEINDVDFPGVCKIKQRRIEIYVGVEDGV